ncbi:hypothetical protein CHU98_g3193 [Xylaria longipes]|nr:hypothetical protein CHU98_g3193 [Xylaria longipes]
MARSPCGHASQVQVRDEYLEFGSGAWDDVSTLRVRGVGYSQGLQNTLYGVVSQWETWISARPYFDDVAKYRNAIIASSATSMGTNRSATVPYGAHQSASKGPPQSRALRHGVSRISDPTLLSVYYNAASACVVSLPLTT